MPKKRVYYVMGELKEGQEVPHGCHAKMSEANEQVRVIKKDGGIFDDGGVHYQPVRIRIFEAREVAAFEMEYKQEEEK